MTAFTKRLPEMQLWKDMTRVYLATRELGGLPAGAISRFKARDDVSSYVGWGLDAYRTGLPRRYVGIVQL